MHHDEHGRCGGRDAGGHGAGVAGACAAEERLGADLAAEDRPQHRLHLPRPAQANDEHRAARPGDDHQFAVDFRRDQKGRGLEFADDAPNAETELIRADEQAALAAALDALPLHLKETIVLREMEGLSYREIAAVMDAPVGTVMSRLARAREQLRRALVTSPLDGGRFHAL